MTIEEYADKIHRKIVNCDSTVDVWAILKKAEIEAAALPWRERNGVMTITSRSALVDEEGAARPREPELQDIVANVPTNDQEEDPAIIYSSNNDEEYAGKKYAGSDYKGPGGTSEDMASKTRDVTWSSKKTWNEKISDSTYMEKVKT